ncbi:hypothetical protein E2H20_16305 [Salmonella enterica subsp. enterica serovar Volkmarsdorf]|nr:hypothetical protein [Salmonella enterica subsp. enterica serovar Volkmarsdorf]
MQFSVYLMDIRRSADILFSGNGYHRVTDSGADEKISGDIGDKVLPFSLDALKGNCRKLLQL